MSDVLIFHNIRWSKYKGAVFSELHRIALRDDKIYEFVQIADTSEVRVILSEVDLRYHNYPHTLLFSGKYQDVPKFRLIKKLLKMLLLSKARIVVLPGYDRFEYWCMLFGALITRKKIAVFCDSTALDQKRNFVKFLLKKFFFNCCDGFFAYGLRSSEYLQEFGVSVSKIYQPCQAAALSFDYLLSDVLASRRAAVGSKANLEFLYVGRLTSIKNLRSLISAFKKVKIRHVEAKLTIVGSGEDLSDLKSFAQNLGLASSISFLGSLDGSSLARRYIEATCLVLPSMSEPWGLVVNEALHYGCPVIVSDRCGCVPELVIEGVTGYSFFAGDDDDLAKKMLLLIEVFSDRELAALRCLELIKEYTPFHAASKINNGCCKMLEATSI